MPTLTEMRRRARGAKDTGLPLATVPEVCPWTVEQVWKVRTEDEHHAN